MSKARAGASFDKLCTVTLQGGGLFGFGLLGQLQAVKEAGLTPIAYAGASAGGLVATLAWAGYSPGEIKAEFRDAVINDAENLMGSPLGDARAANRTELLSLGWFKKKFGNTGAQEGALGRHQARLMVLKMSVGMQLQWKRLYGGIFMPRGVFPGEGFEAKIDAMLRRKLQEELSALSEPAYTAIRARTDAPHIESPEFASYRPTFRDFFYSHYAEGRSRFQPALILSVTNLTLREPQFIDSLRSAYEHLVISDVVMATTAFPFVMRPRTLAIVRDKANNFEPASRASLARHFEAVRDAKASPLELSKECFVDGGVVANFPIWAVAKYVRQTLYGLTITKPMEALRTADGERFVVGGALSPHAADPAASLGAMANKDDDNSFAPLRGLAFRPMVHVGLRLTDAGFAFSEQQRGRPVAFGDIDPSAWTGVNAEHLIKKPSTYFGRLVGMLATDTRNYFEEQAIAESTRVPSSFHRQRLIIVNQRKDAVGWNGHLFEFTSIQKSDIERMFSNGQEEAATVFEKLDFSLPRPKAAIAQGGRGPSMRAVLSESRGDFEQLVKQALTERRYEQSAIDRCFSCARLYLVRETRLVEQYSDPAPSRRAGRPVLNGSAVPHNMARDPAGAKLFIDLQEPNDPDDDDAIERYAFESRRSVIAFPKLMNQWHPSYYHFADNGKVAEIGEITPPSLSFVFPLADLTERSREPLPLHRGGRQKASSGLRRADLSVYHWNEKTDAVLFGVYVLEFFSETLTLDAALFADCKAGALGGRLDPGQDGKFVRLDNPLMRACIRSAHADSETLSELLSRRFPGFEYDAPKNFERRKGSNQRASTVRELSVEAAIFTQREAPLGLSLPPAVAEPDADQPAAPRHPTKALAPER